MYTKKGDDEIIEKKCEKALQHLRPHLHLIRTPLRRLGAQPFACFWLEAMEQGVDRELVEPTQLYKAPNICAVRVLRMEHHVTSVRPRNTDRFARQPQIESGKSLQRMFERSLYTYKTR